MKQASTTPHQIQPPKVEGSFGNVPEMIADFLQSYIDARLREEDGQDGEKKRQAKRVRAAG